MTALRARSKRAGSWLALMLVCGVPAEPLPILHAQEADGAEVQRRIGLEHLENRRFGPALEAYRRAIELDPDNERLYLETADIHLASGAPAEAETTLAEAARRFPGSIAPAYNLLYHDLAELWASTGRLAKASAAMEAAARIEGPIAPAVIHKRIGDYGADLLRLDPALAAYRTALALDPGNAAVQLALGNLHLRRNSLGEARQAFDQVLAAHPDSIDSLHGISEIHRRRGEFEQALAAADQVLERVPDHQNALYIRGTARVRMGQGAAGRADLEAYAALEARSRAAEQRARALNAFRTGAQRHLLEGRNDDAIQVLESGISDYPDAAELYRDLGQALTQAGRHREAIAAYLSMLENGGDAPAAHRELARLYRTIGDIEASDRHQSFYEAGTGARQRP